MKKEENEDEKVELDDKLKKLAKIIKEEGGSPNEYLSVIKESNNKLNDGEEMEGINAYILFDFLKQKDINLNENEKKELINRFKNENYSEQDIIDSQIFQNQLLDMLKEDIKNDDKDDSILDHVREDVGIEGL